MYSVSLNDLHYLFENPPVTQEPPVTETKEVTSNAQVNSARNLSLALAVLALIAVTATTAVLLQDLNLPSAYALLPTVLAALVVLPLFSKAQPTPEAPAKEAPPVFTQTKDSPLFRDDQYPDFLRGLELIGSQHRYT
jgi:hypothetical protein